MNESIISIIAGSFIVGGAVLRYKTINSQEFLNSSKVTLFIFSSLAIGLCLVNLEKTNYLIQDILDSGGIILYFTLLTPAFFPIITRVLKGDYFYTAFRWSSSIFWIPMISFIICYTSIKVSSDYSGFNVLIYPYYFISLGIVLGFIHSILGSLLAGFNIALIISNFYNKGILSIDLGNIFDILSFMGIESSPIQWLIIVVSTILGIHGTFSFEWLKEKVS